MLRILPRREWYIINKKWQRKKSKRRPPHRLIICRHPAGQNWQTQGQSVGLCVLRSPDFARRFWKSCPLSLQYVLKRLLLMLVWRFCHQTARRPLTPDYISDHQSKDLALLVHQAGGSQSLTAMKEELQKTTMKRSAKVLKPRTGGFMPKPYSSRTGHWLITWASAVKWRRWSQ